MIMKIVRYEEKHIQDVVSYELTLRNEEPDWGWEINEEYINKVSSSFCDSKYNNALSFIAYIDNKVVGRIDASLIPTHFDGSMKAYLDWICVLKSYRHKGVAQALMKELRKVLKEEYNVDTLVGLIASNEEAQRFYRSLDKSIIRDEGIWIDC
ncbi:MAG: GNAT family N-acetyltransferase [Erysipelotrichaceae bacterium]|nr:GNAT family N-acetyltransferase [Erysipelotrichaceae bacterium]